MASSVTEEETVGKVERGASYEPTGKFLKDINENGIKRIPRYHDTLASSG